MKYIIRYLHFNRLFYMFKQPDNGPTGLKNVHVSYLFVINISLLVMVKY
jgi:hypothetical protein